MRKTEGQNQEFVISVTEMRKNESREKIKSSVFNMKRCGLQIQI